MTINRAGCLNLDSSQTLQVLLSIVLIRRLGGLSDTELKTLATAQEKFLLVPNTACSASLHTLAVEFAVEFAGVGKTHTHTYKAVEEKQHAKAQQTAFLLSCGSPGCISSLSFSLSFGVLMMLYTKHDDP